MGPSFLDQLKETIFTWKKHQNFHFQPLEIQIALGSPVVLTYPWILLDGIMAYGIGEMIFQERWQSLCSGGQVDRIWGILPSPLLSSEGIAHGSVGRFSEKEATGHIQMTKPLSVEYLKYCHPFQKRYMIVGGDFKVHKKIYASNMSPFLTFWANGDQTTIETIFRYHTPGVGKRIGNGYGKITDIQIHEIPHDYSIWHPQWGLNRPIPIIFPSLLNGHSLPDVVGYVAYRPPYWAKENHTKCFIPAGFA